jgi:betaine-aldehyde dehydrogenase
VPKNGAGGEIVRHANNLVAGEWVGGSAGGLATTNPADGTTVGTYGAAGTDDLDHAVAAARDAFERGGWAARPRLRAQAMLAMADALEAREHEVLDVAVAESGKLRREVHHEFAAGVSEMRYYAGLARTIAGRVQELDEGALSVFTREPVGVAGIIVPWNAPITLLVRSLAPALAAGCTTVVKPAPQTTLTNALLMEAMAGVPGLPPGVLNSVNESDGTVGRAMAAHPDIDAISFTGSSATGRKIMAAASGTLKRLSLELGGKAPSLVFADADLKAAVPTIARCALVMAGQMCTAVARVLVEEARYAEVRDALAAAFRSVVVGRGDDERSQMGPLVDRRARDRVAGLVEGAADHGRLVVRGEAPGGPLAAGAFLTPTLMEVEELSSPYVQEELFGPFLVIERFRDEADAVRRANATRYGLAASVWTRDGARAQRVARALKSGTVWINTHNRLFAEAETGGYRQSGLGRLHGPEGLNDFLETKHVYAEAGWIPGDGVVRG